MKQPDKRAETKWIKSCKSYQNYQGYIDRKVNRFDLTLIDLLYISNFKGGNATINEPEKEINIKLISYSNKLIGIDKEFRNKSLADLTFEQKEKLKILVDDICELTFKESKNRIDGFNVSYLSTLLNAYFPEVIPILDRRVLINLELVKQDDLTDKGRLKIYSIFLKC